MIEPPIVTPIDYEDSQSIELKLVNLDWTEERHIPIQKETKMLSPLQNNKNH